MKKPSFTVYKGPNKKGDPIVGVMTIGGNKGTGPVVSIAYFPRELFDAMREQTYSHISKAAVDYVNRIDSTIKMVCGSCPLSSKETAEKIGQSPCYAQRNVRNAAEAASIVLNAIDNDCEGLNVDMVGQCLSTGSMFGINSFRSAVVGDTGMLPRETALDLMRIITGSGFQVLGYTHQKDATWLQDTHQASTQSLPGKPYDQAHTRIAQGWSVFHVVSSDVDHVDPTLDLCFKQKNKGANCQGCPMKCDGKSKNNTVVVNHYNGAKLKTSKALPLWMAA
tara:strand:+ start:305 stop:1141 length:837 start_codon:yes stop_codon:yes gene_type:complete